MTKEQFEEIEEKEGFYTAMQALQENAYGITTYDILKQYVIKEIERDDNGLALHIWNAVYNSKGDSDWYYYDYTAGTTCTPICLNNADDCEEAGLFN